MILRVRQGMTYANIVSTLCLFLVLGGGAYAAASITGRDIVNGSVRGKDIADGSLTNRDLKRGSLPAGGRGPAGPAGPTGPAGQAGKDGSPDSADQVKAKLLTVDGAGSGVDSDLIDGQTAGAFVADLDSAGGDLSGPFGNLQIGPRTVTRAELASGAGQGCCVFSDFEYQVPAKGCHTKILGFQDADLGEIFFAYPESADLGTGIYLRPTLVAHPGEIVFEICNATNSTATIPFGTYFRMRLIG